jgi:L-iditol 2-dehydrogenase
MAATANQGAVLHGAADLRVQCLPMPEPGPRQVLVAMQLVGICGSDVHYYEHGSIGPFVVRRPQVLGHEPFGVITAAGPGSSRHRVGQRVVVEPGVPCGRCRLCRSGAYNLCPEIEFLGNPPTSDTPSATPTPGPEPTVAGALARFVVVHEDFAHPVPDTISDEAAVLIEPLAVAVHAVRRARIEPGSTVLVTGAGPIGLLAAQAAQAAGATTVIVTDVREEALEHARRIGALAISVADGSVALDGLQPDVLLECSGAPVAIASGIGALAPRGTAVLVGVGPEEAAVPVATIRRREISVTATFRYASAFPAALALAAAGGIELASLITARVPLAQVPEEFAAAVRRRHGGGDPASMKTVVDLRIPETAGRPA